MHLRADHAEYNTPVLLKFIRDNPLGILITALQSPEFPVIQCSHIPWVLDIDDENSGPEVGKLRGHMAKQNAQAKAFIEAIQQLSPTNGCLEQEVSVLFNGPAHSYVTPKFYVETKPVTGKVVPTWNYSAVQVYGKAKIFFDSRNEDTGLFLQKQITDLSKQSEETFLRSSSEQNSSIWEVSDAPTNFVELLKKNIIGIEITIERLEGKFKMSQEMGKGDREGVVKGFESLKTENGLKIAKTVEERGRMKEEAKASASSKA
jgi:transcriptional regulator